MECERAIKGDIFDLAVERPDLIVGNFFGGTLIQLEGVYAA